MKIRISRQFAPLDLGRRRGLESCALVMEIIDAGLRCRVRTEQGAKRQSVHDALALMPERLKSERVDVRAPVGWMGFKGHGIAVYCKSDRAL